MAEPKPLEVEYAAMRSRLTGAQFATVRLLAIERANRRRASPSGTLLSSRQVSLAIDRDRRYARKVLIRLEHLGIFECTLRGAGRRPNAYRFGALDDWRCLSKSQADAVALRAERVAVSRETWTNDPVAVPPSPAQAFVVRSAGPAQSNASAGRKDPRRDGVVADQSAPQSDDVETGDTYSLVRARSLAHSQGGSEQHAQPVIDAVERRTPLIGAPRARVVAACQDLDDTQLRVVAGFVERSALVTATALADVVARAARAGKVIAEASAPSSPLEYFDGSAEEWRQAEGAKPDFSQVRSRLRETAGAEVTQ